jgi:hypothetical protein
VYQKNMAPAVAAVLKTHRLVQAAIMAEESAHGNLMV